MVWIVGSYVDLPWRLNICARRVMDCGAGGNSWLAGVGVNVATVLTVPMVPVDYVIAHSSKILQHVYTLPNSSTKE